MISRIILPVLILWASQVQSQPVPVHHYKVDDYFFQYKPGDKASRIYHSDGGHSTFHMPNDSTAVVRRHQENGKHIRTQYFRVSSTIDSTYVIYANEGSNATRHKIYYRKLMLTSSRKPLFARRIKEE